MWSIQIAAAECSYFLLLLALQCMYRVGIAFTAVSAIFLLRHQFNWEGAAMSLDLTSNDSQINFKMRAVNGRKVYKFEDFTLDAQHLLLFRKDEQLSMTPKVIETLLALVEHRGDVLSKDELMNIVWPDSIVEESNLSQNLYLLRRVLGKTVSGVPVIETLRRRGYRFNAEVTVSNGAKPAETEAAPAEEKESTSGNVNAPVTVAARTFSVERQGNVLAIADWKKDEGIRQPIPASETAISDPDRQPRAKKWVMYLAVAVIAALLLSFSAAGLRFFSSANRGWRGELTITKLTDGEYIDAATVSRDGNYFTYVTNDGEKNHLWLQQTGQANRVEVAEPFEGLVYGTTFSPDSRFIYLVINDKNSAINTLYRVPALGGIKTKIADDVAAQVSFSPDGSEMTFMRASRDNNLGSIVIAASDGTSERVLLSRKGEDGIGMYGGGEWSPDGRTIAWGEINTKAMNRGGCTIVVSDAVTGETKPLSNEKWDNCFRMAWTRDSQGLAFIGTKIDDGLSTRRDQVYYLDINKHESRRLTTDGSRYQYASLGITDNNDLLAVPFNRLSQIWAMDVGGDSRTAVQITNGQADGRSGISPISDGRVVYLTRNGDSLNLWMINSDGSGRKQLTAETSPIEELRSPPDGSFFVFSAKHDGQSHLFSVDANGQNRKQLTFGESDEVDSTISPDGKWIIYNSKVVNGDFGKTALWKMSFDGAEPIRLSDIACDTPHFSPDGKLVSCVSPGWKKIMILSSESGELIKTFDAMKNAVLNVGAAWTSDGKSLVYIVTNKNTSNLYAQPVDGTDVRPLTDFTGGEIYNFSFSRDGSRLFLARGYAVRNAILIKNFR